MPRVKVLDTIDRALRDELDRRAAAAGFGDVLGLTEWLRGQGVEIGKSAVGEHVKGLREEWEQTMADVRASAELARLMVAEDPDQQAALSDAGNRIAQDALLRVTLGLRRQLRDNEITEAALAPLLAQITRASADVGRVAIAQRRHAEAVRKQAEADARAAALEAAKAAGVDHATAEAIASGIRIYLPDNDRTGPAASAR